MNDRVWRASRGQVVVAALWFACGVLLTYLAQRYELTGLSIPLVVVFMISARHLFVGLRGRVAFDDDGLTVVAFDRRRTLTWSDVGRLDVLRTPFGGRGARLATTQGVFRLPVPRHGILLRDRSFDERVAELERRIDGEVRQVHTRRWVRALAILLPIAAICGLVAVTDHPWQSPWWPGRHEATALPDPCTLTAPEPVRETITETTGRDTSSSCTWQGERYQLRVYYVLFEQTPGSSGTDRATDSVPGLLAAATPDPLPGLGDEAYLGFRSLSGNTTDVEVSARRANVSVRVAYGGNQPREQVTADAIAVARDALDAVTLS